MPYFIENAVGNASRPYTTFDEAERVARRRGCGTIHEAPSWSHVDRPKRVELASIATDALDRVWTCLTHRGAELVS